MSIAGNDKFKNDGERVGYLERPFLKVRKTNLLKSINKRRVTKNTCTIVVLTAKVR